MVSLSAIWSCNDQSERDCCKWLVQLHATMSSQRCKHCNALIHSLSLGVSTGWAEPSRETHTSVSWTLMTGRSSVLPHTARHMFLQSSTAASSLTTSFSHLLHHWIYAQYEGKSCLLCLKSLIFAAECVSSVSASQTGTNSSCYWGHRGHVLCILDFEEPVGDLYYTFFKMWVLNWLIPVDCHEIWKSVLQEMYSVNWKELFVPTLNKTETNPHNVKLQPETFCW